MDSLRDKIKCITGNKRQFILMRVAGMDTDIVMNIIGVSRGTYNSWFKNDEFSLVYHELPVLVQEYRQEAVLMLRKQNQLEAVLLEGKVIAKLQEEIDSGEYALAKTHLGREVYSKLITDLDTPAPKTVSGTWLQRIESLNVINGQERISQGGTIDGEFEEVGIQQEEHKESESLSESKPRDDEIKKDTA